MRLSTIMHGNSITICIYLFFTANKVNLHRQSLKGRCPGTNVPGSEYKYHDGEIKTKYSSKTLFLHCFVTETRLRLNLSEKKFPSCLLHNYYAAGGTRDIGRFRRYPKTRAVRSVARRRREFRLAAKEWQNKNGKRMYKNFIFFRPFRVVRARPGNASGSGTRGARKRYTRHGCTAVTATTGWRRHTVASCRPRECVVPIGRGRSGGAGGGRGVGQAVLARPPQRGGPTAPRSLESSATATGAAAATAPCRRADGLSRRRPALRSRCV